MRRAIKRLAVVSACILLAWSAVTSDLRAQVAPPELPTAEREWLFEVLRTAPSEGAGYAIEDQIWRFWMRQAPDRDSAELMNRIMERRQTYDFAGAMEYVNELVALAPQWSEAWNQRATVLFFQEKYDESLDAVERVLELEPKHFGALAGKAVILMQQGRVELGQKALRAALALHPWLKERHMLLPEAPSQKL